MIKKNSLVLARNLVLRALACAMPFQTSCNSVHFKFYHENQLLLSALLFSVLHFRWFCYVTHFIVIYVLF